MATKIIYRECKNCNRTLSVLCTSESIIIAVRCPDCHQAFHDGMVEIELK